MEDSAGTKNGCDMNRRVGNGIKDGYNNDIENGDLNAISIESIVILINIILFNYLIILINNYIYFIKNKSHISNLN